MQVHNHLLPMESSPRKRKIYLQNEGSIPSSTRSCIKKKLFGANSPKLQEISQQSSPNFQNHINRPQVLTEPEAFLSTSGHTDMDPENECHFFKILKSLNRRQCSYCLEF